jgi:rhodanese-related sulfurtransferase
MAPSTSSAPYDAIRTISTEALLQEIRSNVQLTILDVRDRPEVSATGTIRDARIIPLPQLSTRFDELADLRSTPIVVVSRTARRARAAALQLAIVGFEEVSVLEHGIDEWIQLGFPLEQRRGRPEV